MDGGTPGRRPPSVRPRCYFFRAVFLDDFRAGTLAPFSRASLRPIAIACLRLLTVPPDPLFSVPFFRRCIADFTFFDADLPYFAIRPSEGRSANYSPGRGAGVYRT